MARGLNQPASECQLLSLVVAASESPAQAELSVSESESESVTVAPEGPGVAVGLAAAAAAGSPPEAGRALNAADFRQFSETPISVPGSGRPGNLSRLISAATWGAVPRWHKIQPRFPPHESSAGLSAESAAAEPEPGQIRNGPSGWPWPRHK